jgi:hypothetical protein
MASNVRNTAFPVGCNALNVQNYLSKYDVWRSAAVFLHRANLAKVSCPLDQRPHRTPCHSFLLISPIRLCLRCACHIKVCPPRITQMLLWNECFQEHCRSARSPMRSTCLNTRQCQHFQERFYERSAIRTLHRSALLPEIGCKYPSSSGIRQKRSNSVSPAA